MTTRSPRPQNDEQKKPPAWRVEGMPKDEQSDEDRPQRLFPTPPGGRWFWILLVGLLAFNVFVSNTLLQPDTRIAISYSDFLDEIDRENVVSVSSTGETIQAELRRVITDPDDTEIESNLIETERPTFAQDDLLATLRAQGIEVTAEDPDFVPLWQQIIFGFGPTLFILWLFFYMFRRAGSALGGGALGLGRSRAKRYEDT
ncbi:MAG: hypothetical protein R3246_14000, partial [Acidimicrobiia bacterium]|nr:hypothetical protein [Acidimicrobiia bacterium]